MTAAITSADRYGRGRVPGFDLDGETVPAILVDADAAEILAANVSGLETFGLFSYASFPIALDPTLPALVRLRELAALGDAAGSEPEPLSFSSNRRLRPISCRVTHQGNGGSQAFLLRVASEAQQQRDAAPLAVPPPSAPVDEIPNQPAPAEEALPLAVKTDEEQRMRDDAPLAAPPRPAPADEIPGQPAPAEVAVQQAARTEADTLKEIARQIREAGISPRAAGDEVAISEPTPNKDSVSAASVQGAAAKSSEEAEPPPPAPPSKKTVSVLDPDHLAKLAHELKTPLTAIAAAAEVMRDERLGAMGNDRYLSYAADIHENATHALDVITSLLTEGGKPSAPVTRLIALDLNAIAARTVSSMQALAQSRGLTLAFDAEASRPHVVANPTSVRQILLNLLTNAIKFTPRDGDIRVVTGYLDDGRVFLVVRDTGCGMDANKAAACAKAASHEASPAWTRGHGIGLPLVQRLVREMGAEIEIDSAPGKGTVVLIVFGGFARWSA